MSRYWSLAIILGLIIFHFITANEKNFNIISISLISGMFTFRFWIYVLFICSLYWASFGFYDRLFNGNMENFDKKSLIIITILLSSIVSVNAYSSNFDKIFRLANSLHSVWILANLFFTILNSLMLIQLYTSNELVDFTFLP